MGSATAGMASWVSWWTGTVEREGQGLQREAMGGEGGTVVAEGVGEGVGGWGHRLALLLRQGGVGVGHGSAVG
jgi:hypothetical protein